MAEPIKVDCHVHLYPTAADGMAENHGARGVGPHGIARGFNMSDERPWPIYPVAHL